MANTSTRSIAKVTVTFGLISLPVRVIKATDVHGGSHEFHQYHSDDAGRIRQQRVCEACDEVIAYADVARGLEMPDGRVIFITKEDQESLPLVTTKEIEIQQFADADEISPLMFINSYYLEPDGPASAKAYALLLAALAKTKRVGIAKVAFKAESREHLAVLRIEDGLLALSTLLWPSEIRHFHFDALDDLSISTPTLKLAVDLVDSLTAPFDPAQYVDEYGKAMTELIDAKVNGTPIISAPSTKKVSGDKSLEELLAASLKRKPAAGAANKSSRKKAS